MIISQYTTNLKNKLVILVTVAVTLVVVLLGIYIDHILKQSSYKNAHTQISQGYQRLTYNLKNIEYALSEGVSFIQQNEQVSASLDLINNYQDKNNYNAYLLDEEKKIISKQLLDRVKFSFNDNIELYDKNHELIASVTKDNNDYWLSYVSYVDSKATIYKRQEKEIDFKPLDNGNLTQNSLRSSKRHSEVEGTNGNTFVTYHYLDNAVIIKIHQDVFDGRTKALLGYIEMSKVLDVDYFLELSRFLEVKINFSVKPLLESAIADIDIESSGQQFIISQSNKSYSATLSQPIIGGTVYYIAELNKTPLNVLLNKSRTQLFFILVLVILFVSFLMRYIINRKIAQPLSVLMKQVNNIERQDYSPSKSIETGDELEVISKNINRLSRIVHEREESLKKEIDKSKQLAVKLEDSGAHLQTLIKTLPDLVWFKDVDGVYLSCNKRFEEFFGQTEENIIGKTDFDFVSQELAFFFKEKDKNAMASGKPTVNEEEVTYASDGHKELLETIKTPMYSPDGTLIGVLGVGRDITERKRIEEKLVSSSARLTKLSSRLPGMLYQFELDVDGNMSFPYMSDAVEELYQVTAEEVLEDVNTIFSKTHPDDVDKLNNSILKSAQDFTPWKLEYRVLDKDDNVHWFYGNSIPEKMPEGGIRWYGFVTDITKSKEMDETLRRTQKMDALGKLTGGIAHDYNNMLGVMLGYSELLKDMLSEQPQLVEYVDEIIRAGDRGAKLTNKLLSFSRQKGSDEKVLNINEILKNERDLLEKTLTARIKLELKLEDSLWSTYLDENEFEDVILNMSINAMHAIDHSGVLTIETSNCSINETAAMQLELSAGDYIKLNISDTGCGLSEAAKEKIFDPFYSTKGDKGTGLGLTQVYGFVKRSGGAIKVNSIIDDGTQFSLYFPRNLTDDVDVGESKAEKHISLEGKERILVVDDEPALLNLACEVLEKQGYQVFKAEHAIPALEILDEEQIDLMVSDVIMPEIDGYELATIVQDKYPNMKIQLVSGFTGTHMDKNNSNILFKNLLHKPYSSKSLLKCVQGLLIN